VARASTRHRVRSTVLHSTRASAWPWTRHLDSTLDSALWSLQTHAADCSLHSRAALDSPQGIGISTYYLAVALLAAACAPLPGCAVLLPFQTETPLTRSSVSASLSYRNTFLNHIARPATILQSDQRQVLPQNESQHEVGLALIAQSSPQSVAHRARQISVLLRLSLPLRNAQRASVEPRGRAFWHVQRMHEPDSTSHLKKAERSSSSGETG
jgi:hypothetical protein